MKKLNKVLSILLVLALLLGVGTSAAAQRARPRVEIAAWVLVVELDEAGNINHDAERAIFADVAIYRDGDRIATYTTRDHPYEAEVWDSNNLGTYTARLILPSEYAVHPHSLMMWSDWQDCENILYEGSVEGAYLEFTFEARDKAGVAWTNAAMIWFLVADDTAPSHAFTDVQPNNWFYDAVQFVHENGIMTGTTATTFAPNATLSRATVATVLYRMAGSPAVTFSPEFSDVAAGRWYTNAVIWAAKNGIVSGIGGGQFAPNADITREQFATMLHRYAAHMDYDMSTGSLDGFPDAGTVSDWAADAMSWAVHHELIQGDGGRLNPRGTATRAQCATILMRLIETFG